MDFPPRGRRCTTSEFGDLQPGMTPATAEKFVERTVPSRRAAAPRTKGLQDGRFIDGLLVFQFGCQWKELARGVKIHADKRQQRSSLQQGGSRLAGGPAVSFSVPHFQPQKMGNPSLIKSLPRFLARRMREDRKTARGAHFFQQLHRWQILAQKRNRSPH